MSLLFPAMLLGLAGLALPVIIHLIARHRFPVQDFPTTRLLRLERRDNAFARRLVDPWQLLLRLLVLGLLVLAMARPLLPQWSSQPAPRNLVLIVDASASMRMALGDAASAGETPLTWAQAAGAHWLEEITLPSQCALIVAGDEVWIASPFGASPGAARTALAAVQAGEGTGPGLVRALALGADMLSGRREVRSQLVVLTDARATAFATRNQRDLKRLAELRAELGERLEVLVVNVSSGAVENLAITQAAMAGGATQAGDDAHVLARVRNLGAKAHPARLSLTVAGLDEAPARDLELAPGDDVLVDLAARADRSIQSFGKVAINSEDAIPADNLRRVPFTVARPRQVLIVNGVTAAAAPTSTETRQLAGLGATDSADAAVEEVIDGARILQYALNPGRELGLPFGTGIEVVRITPEALPAQTLSTYALVVLYDVSALPPAVMRDLATFVDDGRALLIVCSATLNPMEYNAALGAPLAERPPLSPARIGNEVAAEPPVGLALAWQPEEAAGASAAYAPGPWLAPFRDRRHGDLAVVRYRKFREVLDTIPGAQVLLRTDDGRPLALTAQRGSGRVVLFTFGLELSRSNLAMTKVFPLLTWRLLDYLTGRLEQRPPDSLAAAVPAALAATDSYFRTVDELELGSADAVTSVAPWRLPKTERGMVMVPGLPVGEYWLQRPQARGAGVVASYRRPIVVNPDVRESQTEAVTADELPRLLGAGTRLVTADAVAGLTPRGGEVWRWLVIVVIGLFVVEAVAAYVTGLRRDRQREQEEAAAEVPTT